MSSPLYFATPDVPPQASVSLVNAPDGMGVPAQGMSPVNYWAHLGGLTFNCIDETGIMWFFNDPEGWADGTAVSLAQQQRGGAHGAWMGTSYLEPRAITFAGQVQAPTAVLAWQARNVLLGTIAALSSLGIMDTDTLFEVNEPDALKYAMVRPSDKPTVSPVDQGVFTFSIPIIAKDPRKYGAASTDSMFLPVADVGLTFPVGPFPVTFGGGSSGTIEVNNSGNFPMSPVFTIYGPCTNPSITNTTTDQTVAFGIVLGSSDVLTVDTDLGTVTLNGTAPRMNSVLPGSVMPVILPGSNVLRLTAAAYTTATRADITWSSVWW